MCNFSILTVFVRIFLVKGNQIKYAYEMLLKLATIYIPSQQLVLARLVTLTVDMPGCLGPYEG